MRTIGIGLALVGLVTALLSAPAATAYQDDYCWDSGDGRGCNWAQGQGWYGCWFFAGAYTYDGFVTGAAVCPWGAEGGVYFNEW